ncbi:hypothetical protein LRA02_04180 [Lentilactobacillus rapi]|uniref:Uncharacterized protein n=1 Tax=Lentilactobacillus rapi TaxID=481723 RepID=A0A512PK22_9LACO|nr:hypothetical protein LRA02_04180 [Lentilactobacillus rapi]
MMPKKLNFRIGNPGFKLRKGFNDSLIIGAFRFAVSLGMAIFGQTHTLQVIKMTQV